MQRQPNKAGLPLWHSLMYSTGILLIVCGIPGTILAAFILKVGRDQHTLLFGVYMVVAEVVIASILLYVARQVSKRRHRICTKHDDADA